jgi:hypothetical protein
MFALGMFGIQLVVASIWGAGLLLIAFVRIVTGESDTANGIAKVIVPFILGATGIAIAPVLFYRLVLFCYEYQFGPDMFDRHLFSLDEIGSRLTMLAAVTIGLSLMYLCGYWLFIRKKPIARNGAFLGMLGFIVGIVALVATTQLITENAHEDIAYWESRTLKEYGQIKYPLTISPQMIGEPTKPWQSEDDIKHKIKVLNIKPKYHRKMLLPKGDYHIEITCDVCVKTTQWIKHDSPFLYNLKVQYRPSS